MQNVVDPASCVGNGRNTGRVQGLVGKSRPLKRWKALTLYLEEGQLSIDNNPVERALRGVAIGRKNFLFVGNDAGGERAASFYSIIETCKLNGIEPFAYLCDVLEKLPTWPNKKLHELLPWNWKKTALP